MNILSATEGGSEEDGARRSWRRSHLRLSDLSGTGWEGRVAILGRRFGRKDSQEWR